MMARKQPGADCVSDRGYSAIIVARNDERVIYRAWDEDGKPIQSNGCRAPADFDREWRAA